MNKKSKIITFIIVFLMVGIMSACNIDSDIDSTPEPSLTPAPKIDEEPYSNHLEILFMPRSAQSEKAALSKDDFTIKFFEEKYNVTFNIIDTSSENIEKSYDEILSAYMASAVIPDYMSIDVLGEEKSSYDKIIRSGVAIDVGEFLDNNKSDYPKLVQYIINTDEIEDYKEEDGKLLSLPHYITPDDFVYLVRGDWVKKAGYEISDINTLDIFRELMDIFIQEDYDELETDGFSTGNQRYLDPIFAGYTGSYMFKEIDGQYVDWFTLYEMRESLGFLHLMYETNAFDNDYLLHDGAVSKTKITTGKAGAVATDIKNLPLLDSQLKENIPDGYLEPLPVELMGPSGPVRVTETKTSKANIVSIYFEDPTRIFDMFEYIFTDDGMDLVSYGIEGKHYVFEGDNIVPNYQTYEDEGWKYNLDGTTQGVQNYNEIRNIIAQFEVVSILDYSQNAVDWYHTLIDYENIYTNPFEDNGFTSTKKISALNAVKDKWVDDFISGKRALSDKYWDRFQKEYLEAGAQEQMDFYNSQSSD